MQEYKDFVESTGYGTVGGLCGVNCRHNFIPFNPETMTNNLKEYGLEENKEMYENHQKQRYFERNIRKYRRITGTYKTSLKNAKNDEERHNLKKSYDHYKNLTSKWTKAYRKFSQENSLRTQMDRTKV